ncbi:MAG TPA: sugar transferase [Leptolyngbyaceae cyanobacterium M33_DOE_097]|uniref:STAS domain-containing protein n=1 Tax=Oscillatoriales cyanobacterium SpSt-418 TaxID=2282169 RepID=A0A7C3PBG3_9CYAN|nr:sugar transferase [Leptolyngbyaceae cyanobacterium M33_DOE_097]
MANLSSMNFQATLLNNRCVVAMPASFTVVQAVDFKQRFQQAVQIHQDLRAIALDLSQTRFIDSSGIGALVGCWKIAQKNSIRLILQNVSQQVMTILSLADLDKLFEIEETPITGEMPEASQAISPKPAKLASKLPSPAEVPFVTHPSVQSYPKRLLDITGALVGLSITGVLLPFIAIAIKLDSPGPIFFGQTRCSWMGTRFKMWKFRSMVPDAEQKKHLVKNEASGAIFKSADDPRITRVGRLLRKTSLDELPQFWNVLKGEMSLVGTRPPTPDEVERYEIPQWQRLDIKPGMTGEWQVNGRSSVKNFEDIVNLDLKYQENWSLMYDIQLIFKTVWVVFNKNSGAM